jgi:hypothetical protein
MAHIIETTSHTTYNSRHLRTPLCHPTSKYGGNSHSVGCVQNSNKRFAIHPTLQDIQIAQHITFNINYSMAINMLYPYASTRSLRNMVT